MICHQRILRGMNRRSPIEYMDDVENCLMGICATKSINLFECVLKSSSFRYWSSGQYRGEPDSVLITEGYSARRTRHLPQVLCIFSVLDKSEQLKRKNVKALRHVWQDSSAWRSWLFHHYPSIEAGKGTFSSVRVFVSLFPLHCGYKKVGFSGPLFCYQENSISAWMMKLRPICMQIEFNNWDS